MSQLPSCHEIPTPPATSAIADRCPPERHDDPRWEIIVRLAHQASCRCNRPETCHADEVGEAVLAVYKQWQKGTPLSVLLTAFGATIARRGAANFLRKMGRGAGRLTIRWGDRLNDLCDGRVGHEEVVDFRDLLLTALTAMTAEERLVFDLVIREGLAVRVAAERLGCSWETAVARLRDAITVVRRKAGEKSADC